MKLGKGWKWRLAGGLIGIGILAAGTITVIANYQDSEFQPDGYIDDREKKSNQIVFPGQDVSLGDGQSDESELWEQNEQADSKLKPDDVPTSSMLFQTMKVAGDTDTSETVSDQDTQNTDGEDTVYAQNDPSNPNRDTAPGKDTVVVKPADNKDEKPGNGNSDHKRPGSGDSSKNPSKDPVAPGTTEEPGTTEHETTEHETTDATTEEATTERPGDVDPGVTEQPTEDITTEEPTTEEPDKPEHKDNDTTVPSLPKDDTMFPTEPYPGDDKVDISDDDEFKRYSLTVIGIRDSEDAINELYMGEYLNDQRVLCSVIVYVCVDGVPTYRLTELGDNFRLGEYPYQVNTDQVTLTFYYRPDEKYDWIEGSYTANIRYSSKLLLRGYEDGTFVQQILVPMENPQVELYPYYSSIQGTGNGASGLDELFVGWSETENGECVGPVYNVENTGAKVLYPIKGDTLSDDFSGSWDSYFFALNSSLHYTKFQTLTTYTGVDTTLSIPNGIQVLSLPADLDWDTWTFSYKEYDVVNVPETVLMLGSDYAGSDQAASYSFRVKKAYNVDAKNVVYSSWQGMLFNKDKSILYAEPEEMTDITVPATVSEVYLVNNNHIKEIHFLSDEPAEINFENLSGARIVVPSESYLKYLAAWGKNPGENDNELVADGETEEFEEDENAIYSADKKTLKAVKNTVSGVYVVPEGVEKIAENAFAGCGSIDILILPSTVKTLEDRSIYTNAPDKIVFLGEDAPDVAAETFADTSVLQVYAHAKDNYTEKWSAVLGDRMNDIHYLEFEYVENDAAGFCYLNEERSEYGAAGAIMIHAPATLIYFDDSSDKEITWKEIADEAFSDCQELYIAELPATVKKLHRRAFAGCSALQGVMSYAADSMEVGEDAFADTNSLRFAAFHAKDLDCYTYYGSAAFYGVTGSTEYYFIDCFSPSYFLDNAGGGKLLYGVAADEDGEPTENCFVLGATSDIAGEVVLDPNAIEMANGVFANCSNSFSVSGLEHLIAVGDNAFSYSGVSGEINLSGGLVYLGNRAFQGCDGITGVTIDGSGLSKAVYVSPFGKYAFANCNNLTEVAITGTGYYDISEQAFAYCYNLSSITFAENVGIDSIDAGAFGQTAITDIQIPASVSTLGYAVFDGCYGLTKVTMLTEKAPELASYSWGMAFIFSYNEMPDGWLSVPEGCAQNYIDRWKYYMIGSSPELGTDLTEEELLDGENQVRAMLGMEARTETEDPDSTENSGDTDASGQTGQADDQKDKDRQDAIPVATPGDAEESTTEEEQPVVKEEEKP